MKIIVLALLTFVPWVATSALAADEQYPRHELLLEPTEFAKPEVAERYVILDVRSEEAYEKAHIPGAHRVDHDAWKSAFKGGTDAEGWSRRISELGIAKDSAVVVYDDIGMKDAARIGGCCDSGELKT